MSAPTSFLLTLEGELGLQKADDLARAFAEALSVHDGVVVDASSVKGLDLAVLQVLLSARKTAAERGKTLALAAPCPPLEAVMARAGIADPEGFWMGRAA